ncbi:MAG: hypothetical protein NUW01_07040, partial [Gemmatimonadaceae bacterium]|nr:hypothetical protein [Gemmatimonadaceae bacterium]
ALETDLYDRLLERGTSETQALALVKPLMDKLSKDFDDTLSDVRLKMRLTNPELLADLATWGYYPNPSKAAREILLQYQ